MKNGNKNDALSSLVMVDIIITVGTDIIATIGADTITKFTMLDRIRCEISIIELTNKNLLDIEKKIDSCIATKNNITFDPLKACIVK